MKLLFRVITVVSVCLLLVFNVAAQKRSTGSGRRKASQRRTVYARHNTRPVAAKAYVPVHQYDPKRNADQDIKDAITEAGRTGKRVLLEVGGEWCIWCHIMDDYFEKHPELLALREQNFIMVKINFSDENKNEAVLSRYPKVAGYPHIFVLEKDGTLLHSQNTGLLEEGRGYNLDKFTAFLKEWSPASSSRN